MKSADLLVDAFGRVRDAVHGAVEGLTTDDLTLRVDDTANSIAWLVWHLTRVQDDHMADAADTDQIWTSESWAERFELPFAPTATGYGHRSKDVAAVRVEADLLLGYHDAVHQSTVGFVRDLTDADLDRVVDEAWTPHVTLGVRLVSVIDDDLQHAGQAAFIRGTVERR
jgi:uncharacterized damage-inducible protein DinB